MRCFYIGLLTALMLSACNTEEGSEVADDAAMKWGEAYFNYDLKTASRYVTPESRKWLSFVASNITEADVELLRQQDHGAAVELTSCDQVDDSTWQATLEVEDFLTIDSIGQTARLVSNDEFSIKLVMRNGRAYVKMEGLPQSERHNHD